MDYPEIDCKSNSGRIIALWSVLIVRHLVALIRVLPPGHIRLLTDYVFSFVCMLLFFSVSMPVHRGDGRGFGDPVQGGRNRDSDKTIIPFRSYRCGAESPETRCPYHRRTILRSRSQAGPV